MKALVVALAAAGSMLAVQAHAAVYNFTFSDTTLLQTAVAANAAAQPALVATSPFYTFMLDTSKAVGGPVAGTQFSNVAIYNSGTLLGSDTITFSGTLSGTTPAANAGVSANAVTGRVMNATGAYAFEFDPAVFASGNGSSISFATGSFAGEDTVHGGSSASITISPAAVSAAPEPAAWSLMLGGVAAMGLGLRSRRRQLKPARVRLG